jgi:hypothetical protein
VAVLKGLAIMPQASPCFVLTCIDLTFGFLRFPNTPLIDPRSAIWRVRCCNELGGNHEPSINQEDNR